MDDNLIKSFVIPTFKRPQLLERCLSSVILFCNLPKELIVIDDDSYSAEIGSICIRHFARYVTKNEYQRRGPASSRNIGIQLSQAKYIAFIDDDDFLIGPEFDLLHQRGNNYDLVFGNHFHHQNGVLTKISHQEITIQHLLVINQLPLGSYIIKRNLIRYPFDEDMRSHEDWDFSLKNIFNMNVLAIDDYVIAIEKSNNTTTSNQGLTKNEFWLDFLAIYSKYPYPELAENRVNTLAHFGLKVDPNQLRFEPLASQFNFKNTRQIEYQRRLQHV
jgi:glycosyltransferase involved in cell wall biosynthesis